VAVISMAQTLSLSICCRKKERTADLVRLCWPESGAQLDLLRTPHAFVIQLFEGSEPHRKMSYHCSNCHVCECICCLWCARCGSHMSEVMSSPCTCQTAQTRHQYIGKHKYRTYAWKARACV